MTLLEFFFIISGIIILIIAIDISRKEKFNALHFLVFIGIGSGLLVFTFFPDILNRIGNLFGVARGADVLVYGAIVFLIYFVLLLLSKHTENKESITKLIREIAIENSNKKTITGDEVFLIPCYNESKVIKKTIENIIDSGYKNILVVNDGSKDNSREILNSFQDKIILLNHLKNRGQGAALETGFEYIRRYGDIKYIITFDADGQHDIVDYVEMKRVLETENNIGIILGSRFLEEAKTNIPLKRKIVLKLGILFTFFVSKIHLTDTHNGYRVIRKNILDDIIITQDGMTHASEIIDIISSKRIRYKEMPVNIIYTPYSVAKGQNSSNAFSIVIRTIWTKFFR
ncbi:MAG: DUF2304 family protein [Candidatus Gracilibacteria bacterium]|nr:DUF2304 family protein [Candidatus Gracilibacteria bacterium]